MSKDITLKGLPEIKGYDYTNEYRQPEEGEYYLAQDENSVRQASSSRVEDRAIIMKKLEKGYDPDHLVGLLCWVYDDWSDEREIAVIQEIGNSGEDNQIYIDLGRVAWSHAKPLSLEEIYVYAKRRELLDE